MSIIQKIAIYILPIIFAVTVHEASHAFMANRFGDNTAKFMGRLTLNPLKHLDIVGTIFFPIVSIVIGGFIFGWAKPVPINYAKLENPRRNIFWIALSGPVANFTMALVWALILKISYQLTNYFAQPINLMAQAGIVINVSLMLLNLLPILPLDGGRIVFALLPEAMAKIYARIEPYGMWILLLLLLLGGLKYVIYPLYLIVTNFIMSLI